MRSEYGTHSLRRTKASIIYRATGNLRVVQILLGHSKIENTVRYLWTCNGFAPVTFLIMPPWLRRRAG